MLSEGMFIQVTTVVFTAPLRIFKADFHANEARIYRCVYKNISCGRLCPVSHALLYN